MTENEILYIYASDIMLSDGMQSEKEFVQHGTVSCYQHSVAVACMSIYLAKRFRIPVDMRSLVRGALLHDYFLYDWHETNKDHQLHGFIHATRALENASRDFALTPIESDIIKKHMFPLNPRLPHYRETVIVLLADKICATRETLKR